MKENNLSFFRGLFNGLIITFIIFAVCFGSFMCGFQYHKNHNNLSYQAVNVHPLDSVETNISYLSSNLFIPLSIYPNNITTPDLNNSIISIPSVYFQLTSTITFINFSFDGLPYDSYYSKITSYQYDSWVTFPFLVDYNDFSRVFMIYRLDSSFNFNVVKVLITSEDNFSGNTNFHASRISFYDNNDNVFSFYFCIASDLYLLSYRTYYLSNPSNFGSQESFNAGFEQGRAEGLAANQQSVYDKGFEAGKRLGESNGYQQGVQDSNQYTFLNLLGAVVDAPVQTFIGLLNFEILGFNFLSFLTAILTIGLIIFIIRFVFFRS